MKELANDQQIVDQRHRLLAVSETPPPPAPLPSLGRNVQVWHEMDVTDPDVAAALYRACSGQSDAFQNSVGQELSVVNVIFQTKDSVIKETGELLRKSVCALICADGRVLAGTSGPIYEHACYLLAARRKLPWEPPVRVRIVKRGKVLCLDLIDLGVSKPKTAKPAKQ